MKHGFKALGVAAVMLGSAVLAKVVGQHALADVLRDGANTFFFAAMAVDCIMTWRDDDAKKD